MHAMKRFVFGVDVGGTGVKLGLFSADGTLLEKWEIPTHTQDDGKHILPEIAASIRENLALRGISSQQVAGIGICVPGPVDDDGTVHKCNNLGWGVFNVCEEMTRLLPDIPRVAAGNDANVAALGELWQGGAAGYQSAVMFTLGTGVGGGVILDGKIVAGINGGAGEVGHITVEPRETVRCSCGKYGCLEQYASANGLVFLAKRMLEESDRTSRLRDLPSFTAKDVCDLAREGEVMALEIMDRFGEYLGRAFSFVSCVVDPDVFIIGGGMSRAGSIVTDAAMKHYRRYAFHVSAKTKAVIATLGNDAGIFGCARMVLSNTP